MVHWTFCQTFFKACIVEHGFGVVALTSGTCEVTGAAHILYTSNMYFGMAYTQSFVEPCRRGSVVINTNIQRILP
jgi:hypothetical protein